MPKKPTIRIPAQGAAGAPKPLNPQEQLAAIARGFTQQYQSIAQGVLFNLVHGYAASGDIPEPAKIVEASIKITETFMKEVGPACDNSFDEIVVKPRQTAQEAAEGE